MKIKLFFILLFTIGSLSMSYASFPVTRAAADTEVVENTQEEVVSLAFDAASGKSQVIALVLVALLGGLGIHRFYLGYTWQGIVQLLTAGGCGVWAIIDLVRIITGDLQPKNGSYSKTL
ncbi:MAG: TM2 domain-containing protein [Winogradskyella sp.]|uniref:TM2 domain-containing protein n=1 Tax=Winogradskyella sp. TaxID=1883156 RepID=UPI0038585B3A